MPNIIIKKTGKEVIRLDKNTVADVIKTNDGIIFNLIEKFTISYYDPYMPDSVKELIVNTCNRFAGSLDYEIDVSNYKTPIVGRVAS